MKCELCAKTPLFGHNVSHSKRRTAKRSEPNVHRVTIPLGGKPTRMYLCTRCLRTQNRLLGKQAAATVA
ncbi:MAG: 50S ribosomal protein L28 [Chloroflexi bacterium]|nr:50S ribosomal protein L28 [Chloroflexota bacterium]